MGWRWRKSINIGPAKINLSKTGIGYSLGLKGFRVGQNAKGQKYSQTSIPGTGMYNREYHGSAGAGIRWNVPLILLAIIVLGIIFLTKILR